MMWLVIKLDRFSDRVAHVSFKSIQRLGGGKQGLAVGSVPSQLHHTCVHNMQIETTQSNMVCLKPSQA